VGRLDGGDCTAGAGARSRAAWIQDIDVRIERSPIVRPFCHL
jgi:hypothetical protein